MSTNDTARSELVLRLTDAQIAAIRLRNQRRKKNVGGTGELDLGDISSVNDYLTLAGTDSAVEKKDA
jgi:hypothetical protein